MDRREFEIKQTALLVVRCQLGEAGAFDQLVDRWHPLLTAFLARQLPRDNVDDVAQDVWVRVVRSLPRLTDPLRFAPWFWKVARRTIADSYRHRGPIAREPLVSPDDCAVYDESFERRQDWDRFVSELAHLSPELRIIVDLFYFEQLSIDEIADVAGVAVGTVKSRLFRARAALRAKILPLVDPNQTKGTAR